MIILVGCSPSTRTTAVSQNAQQETSPAYLAHVKSWVMTLYSLRTHHSLLYGAVEEGRVIRERKRSRVEGALAT